MPVLKIRNASGAGESESPTEDYRDVTLARGDQIKDKLVGWAEQVVLPSGWMDRTSLKREEGLDMPKGWRIKQGI